MRYRVGTRGSKLAFAQTKQVIEKLKSAFPEDEFDVVIIRPFHILLPVCT